MCYPASLTLNSAGNKINKIAGESPKHFSKLTLIYLSGNTCPIKNCVQWGIPNSETTVQGTIRVIFRIWDSFC